MARSWARTTMPRCEDMRSTAREPADDGGAELRAGVLVYAQATCASSASSAPSKADAAACYPVAAATPGVEVSVTVSLAAGALRRQRGLASLADELTPRCTCVAIRRVPKPFSRPIMDSTTITHTNGTRITTVSTAAPRPLATKISGTAISKEIREEMKQEVMALQAEHGVTPGLAVVLVGNRPDSATYVRMKKKAAAELGFHSVDVTLPDTATTVRSIPLLPKAAHRTHGAESWLARRRNCWRR